MRTLIDEYTGGCLAIRLAQKTGERYEVIEAVADAMLFRGIPENIVRTKLGPPLAPCVTEYPASRRLRQQALPKHFMICV